MERDGEGPSSHPGGAKGSNCIPKPPNCPIASATFAPPLGAATQHKGIGQGAGGPGVGKGPRLTTLLRICVPTTDTITHRCMWYPGGQKK